MNSFFRRSMRMCFSLLAMAPTLVVGQTTITSTFTASGETAYSVPANAASLQVTVIGAAGSTAQTGGSPPGPAGQGAQVTANLSSPFPATLYVEVGTVGGGGASTYAAKGGANPLFRLARMQVAGARILQIRPATRVLSWPAVVGVVVRTAARLRAALVELAAVLPEDLAQARGALAQAQAMVSPVVQAG